MEKPKPKTAVLISIRPEWCELIANGQKTLEVRKNRPTIEPPFTCYIYQTKCGGIIGEFVCDSVSYYPMPESLNDAKACRDFWSKALLKTSVLREYCYEYGGYMWREYSDLFGWNITELRIYDKPLDLSVLSGLNGLPVKRAPQSWRYVGKLVT